jgi:hypothetical protein
VEAPFIIKRLTRQNGVGGVLSLFANFSNFLGDLYIYNEVESVRTALDSQVWLTIAFKSYGTYVEVQCISSMGLGYKQTIFV